MRWYSFEGASRPGRWKRRSGLLACGRVVSQGRIAEVSETGGIDRVSDAAPSKYYFL